MFFCELYCREHFCSGFYFDDVSKLSFGPCAENAEDVPFNAYLFDVAEAEFCFAFVHEGVESVCVEFQGDDVRPVVLDGAGDFFNALLGNVGRSKKVDVLVPHARPYDAKV